ncbi:MAG: sugar ABC transporter ATP-binding protein [Lachnospirales bacterium]
MQEVFLELKEITKSFGGVHALKGVNLVVKKGIVHCLAGENGSGKSTLIKIISGIHPATSGEIFIENNKIEKISPIDSINTGIQVIYQDFAVFPNLTVAENIAMNKALLTKAKTMKWKEARSLALVAMKKIGATVDPDILVEGLSVANKQMVAICRAVVNDAKMLILDEPTTALTEKEVNNLNKIIKNLKNKGMAIVIVNHKLNEIYEIADELTIIRNGENVAQGSIDQFHRKKFIHCLTGRDIEEKNYIPDNNNQEIFKVKNYSKKDYFKNVNFTINKGDVLGITGLLGSGRSEIGDALFGLLPAESGEIFLNGDEIKIASIQDAIKHGIGYIPEDRLTQGLFMERSIVDNTIVASINKYMKKGKLNLSEMFKVTSNWIKKIGCVASSPYSYVSTLSGGNAQKIVISKWLNTDPKLLVLNGPTVGVDIGSKYDIHKILHNLAKEGIGVIIISDDLSELIQNCNKILIMRDGCVAKEVKSTDINENLLAKLLRSDAEGASTHLHYSKEMT